MIHCLTIARKSEKINIHCTYDDITRSVTEKSTIINFQNFVFEILNCQNDILRNIFNDNEPKEFFNIISICYINMNYVKIWFSTNSA